MSELTSLVDQMVVDLRQWSFDLNSLPASKEDQTKGYSFAIWKDKLKPDIIRIIVQGYQSGRFGIGKMYAQGFRKTQSGQIQELGKDELYEFL